MNELKKYDWMVYVNCMTYNHAPYIRDAMNGFTMQETAFPFVCCIVDDASTDGEPEIIKQYLNEHFDLEDKKVVRHEETDNYVLTFARHKTNKNCHFIVLYLKYNHYSIKKSKLPYISQWKEKAKYVAICEGDDYWTHPNKLKMQVEVQEKDKEIGLVYTDYQLLNERTHATCVIFTPKNIQFGENFKWNIIAQDLMIGTQTTLMRSDLIKNIRSIKEDFEGYMMGDTQLWFHAARLSKVYYIPEVTSVYRKQEIGATGVFNPARRATFLRNCLDLDLHLAYKYGAPQRVIETIKKKFGASCLHAYFASQKYEEAYKLNEDIFAKSPYIFFLIALCERFKIKHLSGLNSVLKIGVKGGMIKL